MDSVTEAQSHWERRSTHQVGERRRAQVLERGRRIVESAYELLEERGLEGLTIRAVLDKTGLSRRALYERFPDKDELVLAVFEEMICRVSRQFTEQVRALSDPLTRLHLIVTCLVLNKNSPDAPDSTFNAHRAAALSREHLRLAESRPDDLQAALSSLVTLIAQQLAHGMQLQQVRPDDPQRLARLIYNLVATTVHAELLTQASASCDGSQRARLAADIWEFCRRAIAA
jgi:AcrR family transcriptional regulator